MAPPGQPKGPSRLLFSLTAAICGCIGKSSIKKSKCREILLQDNLPDFLTHHITAYHNLSKCFLKPNLQRQRMIYIFYSYYCIVSNDQSARSLIQPGEKETGCSR